MGRSAHPDFLCRTRSRRMVVACFVAAHGATAFNAATARAQDPSSALIAAADLPGGDFSDGEAGAPLSLGADGEILLWQRSRFSGGSLAHAAFQQGPAGDRGLVGPGGISLSGPRFGSLSFGGYVDHDPYAALPSAVSLGYDWNGGRLAWRDGRTSLGGRQPLLDRTLQAIRLDLNLPRGSLAILEGVGRVVPRHVLIPGAGSTGPYPVRSAAPILSDSAVVRIDGELLDPSDYNLDAAGGCLTLKNRAVSRTSVIDLRYEEAAPVGISPAPIIGARWQLSTGRKSDISLSFVGRPAGSGGSGAEQTIVEGPFYATGVPMTIRLARGNVTSAVTVTADGVPLLPDTDFALFPDARLLYLRRPLPPGAVIELTYRTLSLAPPGMPAEAVGMEGSQWWRGSQVRWSLTGAGQGGSADITVNTPLTLQGTSISVRLRGSARSFQAEPGLLNSRRQNGIDAGISYQPGQALSLRLMAVDAESDAGMPYLDSAATQQVRTAALRGIRLVGAFTPRLGTAVRWGFDELTEDGRPFRRQRLRAEYTAGPWAVSGLMDHLATSAIGLADFGLSASGQASRSTAALRGPLDSTGGRIQVDLHPGPRIGFSAGAGTNREWIGVQEYRSQQAKISCLVVPMRSVAIFAAFESDHADGSRYIPGDLTAAMPAVVAADDFDPSPDTERHDPGQQPSPQTGIGTPGSTAADAVEDPVGLRRPGGPESAWSPGETGADEAPQHSRQTLAGASNSPSATSAPGSQISSCSVSWQLNPAFSLAVDTESEQDAGVIAAGQRWVSEAAEMSWALPGGLHLTATAGELRSGFGTIAGTATSPLLGLLADYTRRGGWRAHAGVRRSTWRSPAPAVAGGLIGADAFDLTFSHPLPGRLSALLQWQDHSDGGASGFRSRVAGVGITVPIPAGLGVRLRVENTTLSAADHRLNYSANGVTLSLVSAGS